MGPRVPRLSIIIVNWNTRELLAQCLTALFRQSAAGGDAHGRSLSGIGGVEVLVVDNASADGSARMVRVQFPAVRLVANTENVGFARANNQAIEASCGRYVLLLNPDTVVEPGALQALVSFMDQHPTAGAAGARLLDPDGALSHSCHPAPTLAREAWRLFHLDAVWPYARYRMRSWGEDRPRKVDVVQGACMILRRDVLNAVGLLDEDYFIYSEEVDLCHRLKNQGWEVWWVPQAGVVHFGGQSTRQAAPAMFLRLHQSKVLYFRKNHGRLAAQCYKLLLLAAALARLLLSPFVWIETAPHRQQHLALTGQYRMLIGALRAF